MQLAEFLSFYGWVTVHCVSVCYHFFFIHLSDDGHLGCFLILVTINSITMHIGIHMSFQIRVFHLFWMYAQEWDCCVSQRFLKQLSFIIFFPFAILIGWFLLFYILDHLSILLYHLIFYSCLLLIVCFYFSYQSLHFWLGLFYTF